MLADAFAAERLRLSKARGTLFWSLLFVPIVVMLSAIGNAVFMAFVVGKSGHDPATVLGSAVDLSQQAMSALNISGFFLAQIFFMICASQVLAGDYRWETWRLLTPRNTRINLMLGKLLTFGVAAAAGLVALIIGRLLGGIIDALIVGSPIALSRNPGEAVSAFAGLFLICWLELMTLAAVAACVAVATRNGVAALLVPIGLWLVQGFVIAGAQKGFPTPHDPPLHWLAALPALSVNTVKSAIAMDTPAYAQPTSAPFALAFLLAWLVGLVALALFLFRRQDLTRE
ncbi:ABC transporter permease subunit [Caulobacter mirabilis]|uniref:ABC transporter permease n=1 Tax=Caulobacter mirabilis TaxID=69666 RepID=A0A2D2AX43_9CAUL|nr:ABC transporter permease subunit [Caulobacter mirabilis]ATQ42579.1 ABC transporter permease [Caulobacter mirabilis]